MPINQFFLLVTHEFWHCIDLYFYHREAGTSTGLCFVNFRWDLKRIEADETYPTQAERDCALNILNSLTEERFKQEEAYQAQQRAPAVPERPLLWQRRRALTIQKLPIFPKS
ncbi:hypothetical protein BGZ82_008447 [Podila clonocystis]|nr:hypothetical protein BGZ82_008447 [Podila clonocystis]